MEKGRNKKSFKLTNIFTKSKINSVNKNILACVSEIRKGKEILKDLSSIGRSDSVKALQVKRIINEYEMRVYVLWKKRRVLVDKYYGKGKK